MDEPNSAEVTARLCSQGESFTVSEASTCLTVLASRNLVYRVETRKKVVGGSIWALTDACSDLMENDMALSIGVSKGTEIRVGEHTLKVLAIENRQRITVEFKGVEHHLTDQERVELMDNTFVCCGLSKHDADQRPRLAFEAPRHVSIDKLKPVGTS
jgi:hypothetical protein